MSMPVEQLCGNNPPLMSIPPIGEQKIITVAVQDVTQADTDTSRLPLPVNGRWEPGIRKRFPWMGFSAFVVIVLCVMATVLVMKFSDGKQADNWCHGYIGPNVFLSIFSNITNLAIAVAVGNGFAIAWWRRALSRHTVKDLHYSLSFSASFLKIFSKLKYFNLIALAALGTKITIVDSALYQRALGSEIRPTKAYNGPYQSFAASVFPITATMGSNLSSMGNMPSSFSYIVASWMRMPLVATTQLSVIACNARICTFGIKAAGFSVECETSSTPIDYGIDAPRAWSSHKNDGYQNLPLYSMEWSYPQPSSIKNYSRIVLTSTYVHRTNAELGLNGSEGTSLAVQGGTCPTNMTTSICEFRPALLNYTVLQTNQNSKIKSDDKSLNNNPQTENGDDAQLWAQNLDSFDQLSLNCNLTVDGCGDYAQSLRQLKGVEVVKYMDVLEPFEPGTNSSLFGFYLAFKSFFTASVTAGWDGKRWSRYENGSFAFEASRYQQDIPDGYCNYTYQDPLSTTLISQINMLSAAVAMDPSNYYEYFYDMNSPLVQAWHQFKGDDLDRFLRKTNYTVMDVLKVSYDTKRPIGGIDPDQATVRNTSILLTYQDVFYTTSWPFVWGAVAATAAVILCILPVYWGFWELGRKVSLDPFEIAHAFQSPVFASAQSGTGHTDEVLKTVGKNNIQYTEIVDQAGRRYFFQTV